MLQIIAFLESFGDELDGVADISEPNPNLRMVLLLLRGHLEGRVITATALIGASRVPYATANRRLKGMVAAGLIEQRPRTKTGKSFSLHPSEALMEQWAQLSSRVGRLAAGHFEAQQTQSEPEDYYFGGSYMEAKSIPPLQVLPEPLKLLGGLRVLVHGDPTFMVMNNLKRQFEQSIGAQIHQRAFSIDRLHEEAVRNANRDVSRYDIIAVDLPWVGDFAKRGILMPLDEVMDIVSIDPADFHTAGWEAAHWGGKPYGVPAQTTPELLFYRKDMFADAGLEPPATTDALLGAAKALHDPQHGQ
ncbi:MAG: extracellular solute-binding protein, partial [Roseobacter sp.]